MMPETRQIVRKTCFISSDTGMTKSQLYFFSHSKLI